MTFDRAAGPTSRTALHGVGRVLFSRPGTSGHDAIRQDLRVQVQMTRSSFVIRDSIACAALVGGLVFALWTTARGQGQPAQQAAQPLPPDAPFTVAVATSTLEAAPVYLAVARGSANFRFINGGV